MGAIVRRGQAGTIVGLQWPMLHVFQVVRNAYRVTRRTVTAIRDFILGVLRPVGRALAPVGRALATVHNALDERGIAAAALVCPMLIGILSVIAFPPTATEIEAVESGQQKHPRSMSGLARASFIKGRIGMMNFQSDKPGARQAPPKEKVPVKK